jgi:histidinol-phosphate aminotransferase
MSLSRRGFVGAVGLGAAGLLSGTYVVARGREAAAFEAPEDRVWDDGIIRISSNENARGPGPSAIQALHETISPRNGRGYPPDHTDELVETIAAIYGVERNNLTIGTGSGAILAGAVHAYCTGSKGVVTAAPSYGTPASTAERMGIPVTYVPVDASFGLDVGAMADRAVGAGLVFFCNPNNPTGTAHQADVVEQFVRQVKTRSPETAILIDEAYIEYAYDPAIQTAAPLALEFPGVFITRSLSKAHGMAGLRVGYAVGQEETIDAIGGAWNLGSMNTLSAAAATASLRDTQHIADERAENARIREFTIAAFRDLGFDTADSHTNCLFVNLDRPASAFRDACLERGVRVGRDFPPMEQTHSRISLGTMEEMQTSVEVFREVLSA